MLTDLIDEDLKYYPGVVILGPRQVGKTTLAKQQLDLDSETTIMIDLERPSDANKLTDAERYFEDNIGKTILIDEVQRQKELFPIIRYAIDQQRTPKRFILLGSSSDEIIIQSTESLAGRVAYHELHPLNITEVPSAKILDLFLVGGYPEAYQLADKPDRAQNWIGNLVIAHIQRELGVNKLKISPQDMEQLLKMIASLNAQNVNLSELARAMQVTTATMKNYIHFLENAYLVRTLPPYHINTLKRLVKSPKLFVRDNGILNYLMAWTSKDDIEGAYQKGAAWESFVVQQVFALTPASIGKYFYRTQSGSEVDLLLTKGNEVVLAIEIKYSNSPQLTKSSTEAMKEVDAKHNVIITPSSDRYFLNDKVEVMGISHLPAILKELNLSFLK